jgi:hypothetical protein
MGEGVNEWGEPDGVDIHIHIHTQHTLSLTHSLTHSPPFLPLPLTLATKAPPPVRLQLGGVGQIGRLGAEALHVHTEDLICCCCCSYFCFCFVGRGGG